MKHVLRHAEEKLGSSGGIPDPCAELFSGERGGERGKEERARETERYRNAARQRAVYQYSIPKLTFREEGSAKGARRQPTA